MKATRVVDRLRRSPQTVRFRLSVLYAGLFLASGAVLLGLTYGLVASSLPSTTALSKLTDNQRAKITLACNQAEQAARAKAGGKAAGASSPGACAKLAVQSATAAAVDQRDQALHNLLLFSLVGLGVMTLLSGAAGWMMAGRVLRPIAAITDAARRASDSHLGERVNLKGPRDELRELADTFDEMLDRLDRAFATRQRFVADASHELRTPLTVMRTSIDVTLAKPSRSPEQLEAMATKVRRSVDQAERLIDALLTLAVSEHAPPTMAAIDLATIAEDVVDAATVDMARRGLQVTTAFESAWTSGDRSLVERLIGNLVDNAVRHNVPGGWIEVRTGTAEGRVRVEVRNSGPVVAEDVVESLFDPFRRVEQRTGTADGVGLGLAIVRSIAAAHGGTLDARSQADGGLFISVSLPPRAD
jgi:signal transduction histidine kinase